MVKKSSSFQSSKFTTTWLSSRFLRLLRSLTKEQCRIDSQNLARLVQELGWLISFQTSELVPTQKLDFLGYHFDLQRGLVFPTQKKLDRLKDQTVCIRKFHRDISFLGKNIATWKITHETFPVVPEVILEISPVTGQKDPSTRELYKTSKMVGRSTESYGRCTHPSKCSQYSGVHRCFPKSLGCSLK